MAEKTIVTQGQLGDLKSALAQEADMLQFHSGDSMSAAHGWNIINGPASDSSGNDLQLYRDSNGDVVGTKMLHLVLQGVDYYAPIAPTALAGQDPDAGVVPNIDSLLQPGNNSWVTDYATEATGDANLTLSGLLLPHTRQYYNESHGAANGTLQAQVLDSFDSQGHKVGTHVLVLYFGQKQIFIPASTRMGGPPQTLKLTTPCPALIAQQGDYHGTNLTVCPCYLRFESKAGGGPNGDFWIRFIVTGTFPYDVQWQASNNGTSNWQDMVLGQNYAGTGGAGLHAASSSYPASENPHLTGQTSGQIDYSAHPNTPGGNDSGDIWIRVKVTNGSGDTFSCPIKYHIKDNAPCVLCTLALRLGMVSEELYKTDISYLRRHAPRVAMEGYHVWAFAAASLCRRNERVRNLVMPLVVHWMLHVGHLADTVDKPDRIGQALVPVMKYGCMAVGYAARAYRSLKSIASPQGTL